LRRQRLAGSAQITRLAAQTADYIGGGGEELRVILLKAAERHEVIGVLAGALVPILAHAVEQIGVGHVYPVFYP
jgi:hypothetical protein